MRLQKRLAALFMVAGLTAGLSACGASGLTEGSGTNDETGDIVLGMTTPLSGGSAAIGPYMQNGAQLAVDEINAAGGVLGRQLRLQVEDEACDPRTAAAAASKLVTDGVVVSVGGYCSSATLPTLSIFGDANIPMIIPAANSNDLVNQNLPHVFMINGTGSQQAEKAAEFMQETGATAVALVDDNTSYSSDITDSTATVLEGTSASVVNRQSVAAGESDYSAAVTAIMQAQPDFVYWTGYYQEGGLLIKQLRAAGYAGAIMVADGAQDAQLIAIAGAENAEGVFATQTQTPQTVPGGEEWIARYVEAFDVEPGPYSTQAYDAVRVAAEAVTQAGSTDGDEVITALNAIDGFEIFSGPLRFTEQRTLTENGFEILVVEGGAFVLNQ